jgi:hypothetical protein
VFFDYPFLSVVLLDGPLHSVGDVHNFKVSASAIRRLAKFLYAFNQVLIVTHNAFKASVTEL